MNSLKTYLEIKGYSKSSIERNYTDFLRYTLWAEDQHIAPEAATTNEVMSYIQYLRHKPVKPRTIQLYLNSLKNYYKWQIHLGKRPDNPVQHIEIKGVKRTTLYHILSKQELEHLYNAFEIPDENSKFKSQNWFKTSVLASKRNKVILGLIIYQGLGTTELGRLTTKDLKLREGKLFIASTRRSNEREMKLEAHQVLDMMEYTLKTRQELLNLTHKTSESLFVSAGDSGHFRSIISKLIKKLNKQSSRACGEQSRTVTSIKQIRTSVITHWLKTHNLRQVQYMAGHRYVSSTEAYLVNDLDDLTEEIGKFHPIG